MAASTAVLLSIIDVDVVVVHQLWSNSVHLSQVHISASVDGAEASCDDL